MVCPGKCGVVDKFARRTAAISGLITVTYVIWKER